MSYPPSPVYILFRRGFNEGLIRRILSAGELRRVREYRHGPVRESDSGDSREASPAHGVHQAG